MAIFFKMSNNNKKQTIKLSNGDKTHPASIKKPEKTWGNCQLVYLINKQQMKNKLQRNATLEINNTGLLFINKSRR